MTSYPLFVCGQMVLLESPELAAALSALSQMEQEIIFLYYFQRLTHREIGRRYGRAGNTTGPVSYTHLDVYKRQDIYRAF